MSVGADVKYTWRYERSDGTILGDEPNPLPEVAAVDPFPSQGDAESWIGETWQELRAAGVDSVSLLEDERVVYAGMSLHPPA